MLQRRFGQEAACGGHRFPISRRDYAACSTLDWQRKGREGQEKLEREPWRFCQTRSQESLVQARDGETSNVEVVKMFCGRIWGVKGRYEADYVAMAKWKRKVRELCAWSANDMMEGRETRWGQAVKRIPGWKPQARTRSTGGGTGSFPKEIPSSW